MVKRPLRSYYVFMYPSHPLVALGLAQRLHSHSVSLITQEQHLLLFLVLHPAAINLSVIAAQSHYHVHARFSQNSMQVGDVSVQIASLCSFVLSQSRPIPLL